MSPRRIATMSALTVVVAILWPLRVEAHLNSTGLGPIYDGAWHLLLSPEDLVAASAVAVLAALRGARCARVALVALPAAWFAGGLVGLAAQPVSGTATTVVSFLLVGTLIAADVPVSVNLLALLVILLGVVHGYLNGAGIGSPGLGVQALLGLSGLLFVLTALVAAFVVRLRRQWARIAVRVLGSWVVATGLLLLGWTIHASHTM